jgi:hypothetical protein
MSMKITCGVTRKLGTPNYGSLSASCCVEFQAECSPQDDHEGLQRRVREAYASCRQAVHDELAKQQADMLASSAANFDADPSSPPAAGSTTAPSSTNGHHNGNSGRPISEKQVDYLQRLARQIDGLGVHRLDALATKLFGKPLAELTSLNASGLIDALKGIKAGKIELESALNGELPALGLEDA